MSALAALPARFGWGRGRLTLLALLIASAYFAIAFGEQAWRARELQSEVARQQAAIVALDREQATLQAQVDRYATDAYLTYAQGRARRDLNLANPGETLLLVNWGPRVTPAAGAADTQPKATTDGQPNWRRWLELFDRN